MNIKNINELEKHIKATVETKFGDALLDYLNEYSSDFGVIAICKMFAKAAEDTANEMALDYMLDKMRELKYDIEDKCQDSNEEIYLTVVIEDDDFIVEDY